MFRLILAACVACTGTLAFIRLPGAATLVVLEAEAYAELDAPMRVLRGDRSASAAACVDLPLGVGQGWRGKGAGRVVYRLDLPEEGGYSVWARTRWRDGCSNALFLSANDSEAVVFGNDPVFQQWHWVCSPTLRLEKGLNYLTFANHSDGVAMDKIAVTNDPLYVPEGLAEEITHFFDGFAGCDADNTGSWSMESGVWRVVESPAGTTENLGDCLAQFAPGGGTAVGGHKVWHDYDVRVKAMLAAPGSVSLIFFRRDARNFHRLRWEVRDNAGAVTLEQVRNGTSEALSRHALSAAPLDRWSDLYVTVAAGVLSCGVDGAEFRGVPLDAVAAGQIGLEASAAAVYFDNVEVLFHGNR